MLKKLKENQNKNFTTDVNGDIILIRGPGIDRLQAEFCYPRLNILDKTLGTNDATLKNKREISSSKNSSKNKVIQKLPAQKANNIPNENNPTSNFSTINSHTTHNFLSGNNVNILNGNFFERDKDKFSIMPAGSSFELVLLFNSNSFLIFYLKILFLFLIYFDLLYKKA